MMSPDLVAYEQHVTVIGDCVTYTALQFANLSPLFMRNDQTAIVLRQWGRALVWNRKRMIAPSPLVETAILLEPRKVEYHRAKSPPHARETVWEYVMAVDASFVAGFDPIAAEKWPFSPTLVNDA